MGFFISENGLRVKGLRTPNCSWIKNANNRLYPIDTGWGPYMLTSTDEIINAVKRINLSSPGFGINDILISLVVRFNTDLRLAKVFKRIDNKQIPSLFNEEIHLKKFTQRPYVEGKILYYNNMTVRSRNGIPLDPMGYGYSPFATISLDALKLIAPKVKIQFTKHSKPGYVNFIIKEQPDPKEWEKVYASH